MKYAIDYRNGSMGNTILAHALYACSKVTLDLNNFFSATGNSHNIIGLNNTNLIAWHFEEFPRSDINIILKVKCSPWDEMLRCKLSYSKWFNDVPDINNFKKFKFTEPLDNNEWLENLTTKYWDNFKNISPTDNNTLELTLGDYIKGDITQLKLAVNQLGWEWNTNRSDEFHQKMLTVNDTYLKWLVAMQTIVDSCIAFKIINVDINFWERALVIAKICFLQNIKPSDLHWNSLGCFLENNNVSLINSLERLQNGKSI